MGHAAGGRWTKLSQYVEVALKSQTEFAPAKVNVSLHVTGQNAAGYHLLDSLVAFADVGDVLSAAPAQQMSLSVSGPLAADVPTDTRNLVLGAAKLREAPSLHFHLQKNLPVAAGIGGGSSDAAAALRLIERFGVPIAADEAEKLGADVPVCLRAKAQRMQGIGEKLTPLKNFPSLPAILANPAVKISTKDVFKRLAVKTNLPMARDLPRLHSVAQVLSFLSLQTRNDLQDTAVALAPEIAHCLSMLAQTGAAMVRMSGSGATCFALYETKAQADAAFAALKTPPPWWIVRTTLS